MESKTITAARWVSLVAAFVWGAVAEYKLALAVGADQYTAALLPLVLDVYGFAAFKAGRTLHVGGALVTMFGTQMVSHLLTLANTGALHVALSILVSAIPPAVSLACHRLGAHGTAGVAVDTPRVVEMSTAWQGGRASHVIVDEVHDWSPVGDVPAETDDVTDDTAADTDDTADDIPADDDAPLSKTQLAARGAELIAELGTKTAAAAELGVSRQWLHKCMTEAGLA